MSKPPVGDFPFRLVDLTHPLAPDSPLWPGDPQTVRTIAADHNEQGYALHGWTLSEHVGTHTGAPVHFLPDGLTIDAFPIERLLWPAVILSAKDSLPSDGIVTVDWIREQEVQWGHLLPGGAMVVLNCGWAARWPERDRVFEKNSAGQFSWPGFGSETVDWLIAERGIAGLGTDTPGIDPGADTSFSAGLRCAEAGLLHLENLANLDRLPAIGAWIFAAPLVLEKGTGSPGRIVGILP